jgi:hypothetical protein
MNRVRELHTADVTPAIPSRRRPSFLREVPDWLQIGVIWGAAAAYTFFLISRHVNTTPQAGLVFNEMLVRLLHGHFDVSPSHIAGEAFVYKGRTYAYFGIFCALLRLPLLLIGDVRADITKLSMMFATALSLAARLAALRIAMTHAKGLSSESRLIILSAVALGGESIQYLRPSIYQEVCSWGEALASIFVLLAVQRTLGAEAKAGRLYAAMALIAGLALLCRVSFGFGLYAALGLMLCVEGWSQRARLLNLRALAPAALILALFLGITGAVNEARWDGPLTFVPIRYQLYMRRLMPDRVYRLDHYGPTNLRRLPFALQYYFAPIWVLRDQHGAMLFQQTQLDLFDSVELPPSSFFLSDPAVCVLAGCAMWGLARRPDRTPNSPFAAACILGLACPAVVMLLAISLTFRYRMDFYPVLDFAACVGAARLRPSPARQPSRLFLSMAGLGAGVSLISLILYSYTPFGPAVDFDMRGGWITPILEVAHDRDPYIGHLLPDGRRVNVPASRN